MLMQNKNFWNNRITLFCTVKPKSKLGRTLLSNTTSTINTTTAYKPTNTKVSTKAQLKAVESHTSYKKVIPTVHSNSLDQHDMAAEDILVILSH